MLTSRLQMWMPNKYFIQKDYPEPYVGCIAQNGQNKCV
jgi:hypothetical protein